jgi:hypothetical protein
MKAYIKIDATKPPEDDDDYITDHGQLQYSPDDKVWKAKIDDYWETFSPKWWLKGINLSDLMIEAVKCYNEGCEILIEINEPIVSIEKFIPAFLAQKGIVIKD